MSAVSATFGIPVSMSSLLSSQRAIAKLRGPGVITASSRLPSAWIRVIPSGVKNASRRVSCVAVGTSANSSFEERTVSEVADGLAEVSATPYADKIDR